MSARERDTRRRVQEYVQRQKAYVPTYTSERFVDQPSGTPPRSDAFGFGTPVLRPRVPVNKSSSQPQPAQKAGPSTSRAHTAESRGEATQDATPRRKRQPPDPDSERAARLADRRARKRKKRAIINPPQNRDGDSDTVPTAEPKKGAKGNKAKRPAALALLYGFSATNVTKDRLTLKPTPSLGVFNKGRASAKKKVTAASKFSETEFLNKTNEQAAADSVKIDADSDGSSVSSVSKPRGGRTTNCTKDKAAKTAPKSPKAPTSTPAESEVWDIELQSRLPSSVGDVSTGPGANDSAPIVLDPRGAAWSTSLNKAVEHDSNKNRTRSLSVMHHSEVHSPLARSDLCDGPGTKDALSIHPSHSASQVGYRTQAADTQPPEARQMTSKYFTAPTPVSIQKNATICMPRSGSNGNFDECDHRTSDQDVQYIASHAQSTALPIRSVSSPAQPILEFQMWHDVAPLVFSSDCASDDDCYAPVHVPLVPLGAGGGGCFTSSVIGVREYDTCNPQQGSLHSMSTGLGGRDVGTEHFEGGFDSLEMAHEDDSEEFDPGEEWYQDYAVYNEESMCADDGEGASQFFEGRALLLGVPEWAGDQVLSGLAQAEMDVASQLRDHWRPQRLS